MKHNLFVSVPATKADLRRMRNRVLLKTGIGLILWIALCAIVGALLPRAL